MRAALTHFAAAVEYGEAADLDQLVTDAICMRLSAGIDALARLDPEVRELLLGDNWPLMWGMRNRIVHGYLTVSSEIVRKTIDEDVADIIAMIGTELSDQIR